MVFIFPIAASIKSIFCRTIDSNTGEWIHCFDLPFLIFVYAPVHFIYLGIFHAICIKPVLLAYYDNYADTISKEGRVFLNYWNWDSSRHRLPSIDDYDVKGKMTKGRRRPLYYFVVDEDVLDSIENNKARKGFAINATLSLIFGSFSGLQPVLLGFGFDHIITIVFFVLCLVNYVLFVYFFAKLVWLQSKYHAFKNTVALWLSFLFGAGVAAVFSVAGYFNTINIFNEKGKLMVHLVDGATLLGFCLLAPYISPLFIAPI